MTTLKPFVRITILSTILACLLIYLGIKYHWGDYLKPSKPAVVKLAIPDTDTITEFENTIDTDNTVVNKNEFNIDQESDSSSNLLSSMNKEQIAEQCIKLLSKTLIDKLTLELATVNCVVSNYQETFQSNTINPDQAKLIKSRKLVFQKKCQQQYPVQNSNNAIESQLLVGMCVSDRMNQQ